jgi:2-amino-4-hydroxy-6-hydroxymethyldihydropteridine diphosphokinase
MTVVYLGLGSNIEDKRENINKAIAALKEFSALQKISPLYVTEPVGVKDQEWFLNGVVEIVTDLPPTALLEKVKSIEKSLGRKETVTGGPRTIDIDILFYGDLVLQTQHLIIPHPRIQERLFVLRPMMDLNPGLVHPILHKTIQQLYAMNPRSKSVVPLE